jgi:hypothetical protein
MATVWTPLGALVFEAFTTVQRDALSAQERMVIYNSTSAQFEIYIGSDWKDFAEYIGTIGATEHEEITSGDLHPQYADPQQPEEITGSWALLSGGRIGPVAGDPPEGEVIVQVKTTTGAPTHSATRGVFCVNTVDLAVYVTLVSGTTWTQIAKYTDLHAESHDYDSHTGGVPYGDVEYDDATSDPLIDGEAAADGTRITFTLSTTRNTPMPKLSAPSRPRPPLT